MTRRAPTTNSLERGNLLVVDDVEVNRELLRQDLEDEGFEVTTVASGEACLAAVQSSPPEVILLDIQMSGMDGIETCRRLKADPTTKHIPVLFVTGHRAGDENAIAALRAGGNDFLPKPYSPEILVARVGCQLTIARAYASMRNQAITDELTGAYSRRYLFDALRRAIKSTTRAAHCIGCLLADVDFFKAVNDSRGHLEGDRMLCEIVNVIRSSVRETDLVGRYGGEEFVVLLPQTDVQGTLIVGEKIRAAVAERCAPITISIGAAALCRDRIAVVLSQSGVEGLITLLMREADTAVYAAKAAGRNRVVGPVA